MLAVPLIVAFMAESNQIVPDEPKRWLLGDRNDVVDFSAGSGPASLVAVFTEWVELAVS